MTDAELKIEALRAANAAISTSRGGMPMAPSAPGEALTLARTIHAWFTEARAVPVPAPRTSTRATAALKKTLARRARK